MQCQYRSATITHFARVSYHITTKIASKMSMVESFLRISAGLPGSLSYVDLLFCREQVSTCFCRKGSTRDIISGVLKTRSAEGCNLKGCILTYEKGAPLEIIFWKFSVSFKAPLRNFVKSSFLVALKTVGCKLATAVKRGLSRKVSRVISRKATFQNMPIHVLEISAKLQNAEIYTVTLLKSVCITDAHPTISKILGTLTENFSSGVSFSTIIVGRIGQVELLKRSAT